MPDMAEVAAMLRAGDALIEAHRQSARLFREVEGSTGRHARYHERYAAGLEEFMGRQWAAARLLGMFAEADRLTLEAQFQRPSALSTSEETTTPCQPS